MTSNAILDKQLDSFFALTNDIRYVALYRNQQLAFRQKDGISDNSLLESDKYEELLVNPSLITIARQRGNIDCGGMNYLIVRYGSFYQLVMPISDGHVSICFQLSANPITFIDEVLCVVGDLPDALAV